MAFRGAPTLYEAADRLRSALNAMPDHGNPSPRKLTDLMTSASSVIWAIDWLANRLPLPEQVRSVLEDVAMLDASAPDVVARNVREWRLPVRAAEILAEHLPPADPAQDPLPLDADGAAA